MGIEREETPRGRPTPDLASGHPGLGLSIPTLFENESPSSGNELSHTEEMEFYFHKYRGNTHSRIAKRGWGLKLGS